MKAPFKLCPGLGLVLATATILPAASFYVAPKGDDHNAGTIDRPWATLAGARDGVRASGKLGREAIEVNFAAGVYYLDSTVVFSADDSGTALAPVSHRPAAPRRPARAEGCDRHVARPLGDAGQGRTPGPLNL